MMLARALLAILVPVACLLVLSCAKDKLAASNDLWNTVVSTYITRGELDGFNISVVDYEGIRRAQAFYDYLRAIRDVDTKGFNRSEVYGFFMNVYNAFAIKMILDHSCDSSLGSCHPIQSIRDIGTSLKPVWCMEAGYAANQSWTLQEIENRLRDPAPFQEDPRLHACIVCASISCPDLRATAFDSATIDEQMTDQMKKFLQNKEKGLWLDKDSNTLYLSHIFEWFEGDFNSSGSLENFVMQYAPPDTVNYLKSNNVTFQFFDYNWNLNGQVKCNCTM